MTYDDFVIKYNGKYLDSNGDKRFECKDLFNRYNEEVVKGARIYGNAVDLWNNSTAKKYYTQIANTPTGVPQKGDVLVWGKAIGPYGHVAICDSANVFWFMSFDQNWPVYSRCHVQFHNYRGLLGWLRKKV